MTHRSSDQGRSLSPAQKRYFRAGLLAWYEANKRFFPWRETNHPCEVAVAEILLRQTFARKVVPVYNHLLVRYPDLSSLAAANAAEIRELIRPLGLLYRAKELVALAQQVVDRHGGHFPDNREALEALPGIGPYAASAILCFAFGHPEPIVDTNVLRVYRRAFGVRQHTTQAGPDKDTLTIATAMMPKDRRAHDFNLALLDFAALVCTHYSPECPQCPLSKGCAFLAQGG